MVPIFIGMVVFALVMRSREGQMIASRLYDYVRFGWLVPQDVPLIATLRGRKALRQNAKRYGPQAEAAAKAFQQNATELAYLRDKIVRQVIGPDALETEKQLLDELRERRPSVPFPPMPAFAQAAPQFQGPPGGPGGPVVRGADAGWPMPGGPVRVRLGGAVSRCGAEASGSAGRLSSALSRGIPRATRLPSGPARLPTGTPWSARTAGGIRSVSTIAVTATRPRRQTGTR